MTAAAAASAAAARMGAIDMATSAHATPAPRDMLKVIEDLVAIRPSNWEDDRDPEQRRAWRAADLMIARVHAHGR